MKRLSDRMDLHERMNRIPMQRLGTVDDIGFAAVFLASPMESYIVDAQLIVEGGNGLSGSAIGAQKVLRS